jgi:hypothetical protein
MEQVGTRAQGMAGLVFWGHLASREVITGDGRKVGVARGILIDKDWKISQIVVEVKKEILDEVGIEMKHSVINVAMVNLPTSYVEVAADVVRLNTDLAGLRGKVQVYEIRK